MRRLSCVLLPVAFATPLWAQDDDGGPVTPPAGSPAPVERPGDLSDPEARIDPAEPEADADGVAVIDAVKTPVWERLREDDDAYAACLLALDTHGTRYREAAPVTDPEVDDCGIARPVEILEIVPGVALKPDSLMRCETARALADWVATFVVPAARMLPERGDVVGLEHGTTYLCRRRNDAPDGRISEHGFGNAIDVVAFDFARGEPIRVEPRMREGSLEEAFQRAVRAASCLSFTTVIGPGTDAAHADHLHLDVKARRGGFRLCQ